MPSILENLYPSTAVIYVVVVVVGGRTIITHMQRADELAKCVRDICRCCKYGGK